MATDSITIEDGQAAAKPLFGMTPEELRAVVVALGQSKYRAVQLAEALYKQRLQSLDEITTLPEDLRQRLAAEGYSVGLPRIAQAARSIDGTERYLMRMADGETVETVWMPDGDGGERGDGSEAAVEEEASEQEQQYKRATICISSQVGCAVNCQFCLTARLGMRRNLTAGEIAGQVAAVLNRQRVRIGSGRGVEMPSRINLVFMGMGEPFLNYDAFMQSVHDGIYQRHRARNPPLRRGTRPAQAGAQPQRVERRRAGAHHAGDAQMEYQCAAGCVARDSAGQARVRDV